MLIFQHGVFERYHSLFCFFPSIFPLHQKEIWRTTLICFFQSWRKFNVYYCTMQYSQHSMWDLGLNCGQPTVQTCTIDSVCENLQKPFGTKRVVFQPLWCSQICGIWDLETAQVHVYIFNAFRSTKWLWSNTAIRQTRQARKDCCSWQLGSVGWLLPVSVDALTVRLWTVTNGANMNICGLINHESHLMKHAMCRIVHHSMHCTRHTSCGLREKSSN